MKKIKWGVIGTAGIARSCTIPGMIQAYNCELYAIAGRSIDKAEQFKEKFGFEKAYGSGSGSGIYCAAKYFTL